MVGIYLYRYVQIISISKFTLFIYCSKLKNALNVFSFGNASATNNVRTWDLCPKAKAKELEFSTF